MKKIRYAVATELALRISKSFCSSVSQTVTSCLENKRYSELIGLSVDPSGYTNSSEFAVDYLLTEMMSKFPNFDLSLDRSAVAFEKFLSVEKDLSSVDLRLRSWHRDLVFDDPRRWVLHSAREKIRHLLRDFSWSRAERYFAFGPGASIGCSRKQRDKYSKFGKQNPTVTMGCYDLAWAAITSNPHWFELNTGGSGPLYLDIVEGNKVVTVPKNAKTDRVIAIEPQMNMFIQKGIGGLIRRSLLTVGVDLNDQVPNQDLAREGSLTGEFATIDLSSASDSISLLLVEQLLPPDWTDAIKQARSPRGVLPDGTRIEYRKVSSMGNGYTFELESLIFWAISSACTDYLKLSDRRIRVYGDDLVVHTDACSLVIQVLDFVGFSTNKKKTFTTGPFRESCGKHFFRGDDVTPFYFREEVDRDERLLWAANTVKDFSFRLFGSGWGLDIRLKGVWDFIVSQLSNCKKILGPLKFNGSLSDSCLGVDFDEACPPRAKFQHDGWQYGRLIRKYASREKFSTPGFVAWTEESRKGLSSQSYIPARLSLYDWVKSVEQGVSRTSFPKDSYKLRYTTGVTPQWFNTGPWIGDYSAP